MSVTLVGPYSATLPITASATTWLLKDPLNSSVNLAINPQIEHTTTPTEKTTVFHPLGRTRPVVVADTIEGEDGHLELLVLTDADYVALRAVIVLQRVLLLQSPFGYQWYIRIVGPRKYHLAQSSVGNPIRTLSIDYVEVDAP